VSFHDTNGAHFSPRTSHLSFSYWINLTNLTQTGNDTGTLSKANAAQSYEWISWYRASDHKLYVGASSNGTTLVSVAWSTPVTASAWYFVAGGWDGSNVWISVNGGARQTVQLVAGSLATTTNGLFVGLESGSGGWFNGKMDEIGVWIGRDLTDAEVVQLYNGGAGLPFSSF
jgi:hypothetical protein